MKKSSTVATERKQIFKQPRLTIGLDLGDRTCHSCTLDEAGYNGACQQPHTEFARPSARFRLVRETCG